MTSSHQTSVMTAKGGSSDDEDTSVRNTLMEDAEDLAAFHERAEEPTLAFEDVVRELDSRDQSLRGSVLRYDDPLEPVGLEDWESPVEVVMPPDALKTRQRGRDRRS
jgi:hypothetical protein